MVIHNNTYLSPEEALDVLEKVSKKNYSYRYVYALLLFIFGIAIMLLSFTEDDFTRSLTIGGSFFGIGVLFLIYNIISIKRIPKEIKKSNPLVLEDGIVNEFIFKEESFSVKCKIGSINNKYEYKYNELSKIINEKLASITSQLM